MALPWHTAKFIDIKDETPNTKRFWLQIPELEEFDFTPGQFVMLDFPVHEKPAKRLRSYSIASQPDGSNVIELVIVYVEDGSASKYLWEDVDIGSEILLRGPMGKFVLPDELDRDICFICTGTGVGPFRSMLWDIYHTNRACQNLYLIFGSRYISDILYYQEMEELAQKMDNFEYVVTLSRETSPEWMGGKGYVHGVYEELFADHRPAHFYLCGWKDMIDEARQKIRDMGYDRKSIHVEIYG